jgi:hypothetical protein
MTTQIFFENQTKISFNLYDLDHNHYGIILSGQRNSLTLPYSDTFRKQYQLIETSQPGAALFFSININGELAEINPSSGLAQLRITTLKHQHLPITTTINDIGNILLIQKLTQPVKVPKDTLLIIFPNHLANPLEHFPEKVVFYNPTLPVF